MVNPTLKDLPRLIAAPYTGRSLMVSQAYAGVGVLVRVGVAVRVGVNVIVGVKVGAAVEVTVFVSVKVGGGAKDGKTEAVKVAVPVGVAVAVGVGLVASHFSIKGEPRKAAIMVEAAPIIATIIKIFGCLLCSIWDLLGYFLRMITSLSNQQAVRWTLTDSQFPVLAVG